MKKPKVLIVASRYNYQILLMRSATKELNKYKILYETIYCNGAF